MKATTFRFVIAVLFALGLAGAAGASDDYPNRPITLVVPFAAGGSTDNYARLLARHLKDKLGQPVVVENKPGAGSIVGAEFVVGSKPDGYTFLYGSNTNLVTYEFIAKKRSYDPRTALVPFHGLQISPPTLIARTDAPFKDAKELIAYAKANPGKVNYATPGYNSSPHIITELLMLEAGISMTHIPYKGESIAIGDMLKGLVDVMFSYPQPFQGQIEAGKLRMLGVSGAERLGGQKDVPTFVEIGLPGVVYGNWAVMALPAGVPAPVAKKLTEAFAAVLKEPEVIKFFAEQGATIMPLTGKPLTDFLDGERVRIKEIVTKANIQPE